MKIPRNLSRLLASTLLAVALCLSPMRAHATSKEIIELQTQVNQLLDQVQRLQSTLDAKFGLLQHLVEQTADNANRMSSAVESLQQKIAAQNEALSGKLDSTAGSVQSVTDSMDEMKSRLNKLEKSIQDVQTQLQSMQAQPQPQAPPATPGTVAPGTQAPGPQGTQGGGPPIAGPAPAGANPAPPLDETYQAGLRDFNGARYQVAQGEFQEVVQYYPQDDLAGQAQFYLGEIAYRQQDYSNAVEAYNAVLEGHSNNTKAAAAQLHKGLALLAMNKRSAGVDELRALVHKHPQSPEADQARRRLAGMGVHLTATNR